MTAARNVTQPQPGPQTRFAACPADFALYGGSAGGGKSWALVFEALRWVGLPGYAAAIFRRTSTQLTGGGSVWEECQGLAPLFGGWPRENRLEFRFPSGSILEFNHLQHEKDKHNHQSKQYALICFDELTQFSETQFFYMLSRNRSVCGVRPYIRASCNPDPDSWVRRFIDWWIGEDGLPIPERDGVVRWFVRIDDEIHWADTEEQLRQKFSHLPPEEVRPLSFTFIAASLDDNPALTKKDPGYKARLMALPKVEREQLLGGNWNIKASAGLVFQADWFEIVDAPPLRPLRTCRAWDKAATKPSPTNPDPDWTCGLKYSRDGNGLFFIEDVILMRDRAMAVDNRITSTAARDSKRCTVALWQDPGAAGKKDIEHMQRLLSGYTTHVERASRDKVTYAGPVSSQAEAGNVKLVRGPWNDRFLAELEAFPDANHDDCVDGLSLAHLTIGDDPGDWLRKMNTR